MRRVLTSGCGRHPRAPGVRPPEGTPRRCVRGPRPSFAKTGVYGISVGELSLIQTEDPAFPDDRTRTKVAAGAWVFEISGLTSGDHRLVIRQRVFGQLAKAVFRITVI